MSLVVNHERAKLINAIIYFVRKTQRCHTLKLFKLLNFLDFEHFRLTGHGVTGMTYRAWPNGPAPSELWRELLGPRGDLAAAISVMPVKDDITDKTLKRIIKPKRNFDAHYFSPREMQIMEQLAFIFLEADASDMTRVSHASEMPWGKANKAGSNQPLPYELALECRAVLPELDGLSREEYEYRKEAFRDIDAA